MTQQPRDLLRDMLADAADGPTRAATGETVRRRAVQRRTRRRATAGALSLTAALVLLGVSVSGTSTLSTDLQPRPAAPSQQVVSPTPEPGPPDPAPEATTAPEPPAPDPSATAEGPGGAPTDLSSAQARDRLAAFRFPTEDLWESQASEDFPHVVTESVRAWASGGCEVSAPQGALAMRTSVLSGPENANVRQIAVFPDAATAAAAFADLRAATRACQDQVTREAAAEMPVTFVGGQLDHGDESFWTAYVPMSASTDADGATTVSEMPFGIAEVLVLEGNVVTVAGDPAFLEAGRAETVAQLSGEWEQTRSGYRDLLR